MRGKRYGSEMERAFKTFDSFEESDEEDRRYYLSLTPSERMEILFELIERYQGNEASKGLERVYRIRHLHDAEDENHPVVVEGKGSTGPVP